ncbi:MAG: hypothetical protein AB7W59_05285 [Acidimicrobiia bacterium]
MNARRAAVMTLVLAVAPLTTLACGTMGSETGASTTTTAVVAARPVEPATSSTTVVAATSSTSVVAPEPSVGPPAPTAGTKPGVPDAPAQELPPPATEPHEERFEQPAATTWDTRRWDGDAGGAGEVSVREGVGRMVIDPRGTYEWARAVDTAASYEDAEIRAVIAPRTDGIGSVYIGVRGSGAWRPATPYLPARGLVVEYAFAEGLESELRLLEVGDGTIGDVARSAAAPTPVDARSHLVVKVEGTTVRAKVWPAGEQEPSGWALEVDTDVGGSGTVHFSYRDDPDGTLDWDDVFITPL